MPYDRGGMEWGGGIPSQPTRGSGERRKLPERGPGRNQGRQESLADAKVSARQQCVYEGPSEEIYSKSTICDFLLMVNTNRRRITYGLRDIFGCRG